MSFFRSTTPQFIWIFILGCIVSTPSSVLSQATSILNNPGFETGTTGWSFFTDGTGGYSTVQPGFEGTNAARLTITTTGTNIQLFQSGVTLKANTNYTLSFAAYSSNGRDFAVALQKHTTPFTGYGLNSVVVDLGTGWSTHTLTFTTTGFTGTVNDGRFRFVVNSYATAGTIYYIDNVLLYETPLVGDPPVIIGQPQNQVVASGATATFSVSAVGTAPLAYQWQKNGVNITGAASSSYTTPATSVADNGSTFRCVVTNFFGSQTSNPATLSVLVLPPSVAQHPQNQTVAVGQSATFSVSATGTLPLGYQWQKNGVNISGATSASYTTPAVVLADNGAVYRCMVTNSAGTDLSNGALLTVAYLAPTITQHPQNTSVATGQSATFRVAASGSPTLTYQWQKNGTNIPGATSPSYTTPLNGLPDDGSVYRCIVSNDAGNVASNNATLSVTQPMTALSPRPGDIYKEFTVIMNAGGTSKQWRVTDPGALNAGAQQFKPNSILSLSIDDTVGAIRAEAIIDMWGGHTGTTNKRFRLNGNAYLTIPELGAANGIPAGKQGQCYQHMVNPVIAVPLSHLRQGTNTIEGTSGAQTCFNFNWGQWGWYGVTVRVYYNSSKAHATGTIVSPVSGSMIGENPVIAATAMGGAGVSRVEFLAYYDGYDTDGDGIFQDYHQNFHRLKTENSLITKNHVGTAIGAPYQVTWNTQFVPDQTPGHVRLIARIRNNAGVWFVTDEVKNLTLQRDSVRVKMYKPASVAENLNVRSGRTTATFTYQFPSGDNPAQALGAQMHFRTWNGSNAGATTGETFYVRLNTWTAPVFGEGDFYSYDIVNVPTSALKTGTNTITVFSNTIHHGIDVLWPGPAIVVRYSSVPIVSPQITMQPSPQNVTFGQTGTFTVGATGTQPLSYQWQKNNVNITGATSSSYTTPATTLADNGAVYRCVVSNVGGTVNSAGATLTIVGVPPAIQMQPISQAIQSGKQAAFSVVSSGSEPLSYQWRKNGVDISGATSAWYVSPALSLADSGAQFTCRVSNSGGAVVTNPAIISVLSTTPPSSLVSDDFNTYVLNPALWTFINPGVPSTLSLVGTGTNDALVSIALAGGSAHDMWTDGPMAPRILQPTNNTDFEVEIKFQNPLVLQNFVGQGLVVEQDLTNYIRFNFIGRATGTQVYAASFSNGTPTARYQISISNGTPLYMRVKREGNVWTHRYSYNGTTWTTAGTFSHAMTVGRVGVYFSNSAGNPIPAFTGAADYFFNVASPISPEDGSALPVTILAHPASQSIAAGRPVTFTVNAAGSPPLTYQWEWDGVPIGGATGTSYSLPLTKRSDSGSRFRCVVTNPGNPPVTSNQATLTVLPHPSGIISDDFNAFGVLPHWTVHNPLGALITTTGTNTQDARLTIALPAGVEHNTWSTNNSAPRLIQPSANTDFELESKFESNFTNQLQFQGILVQQDPQNFIRFDFNRATSLFAYSASFVNGDPTTRYTAGIPDGNPIYMRVRRTGNQWLQQYSFDRQTWTNAASFSHTLNVTGVGVLAGNAGTNPPAFTANFDYFFLTAEPIIPEDGGVAVDTFPPVIRNISTVQGATNLLVEWATNEPATSTVQYGLTTAYELGSISRSGLETTHRLDVTGLQPNTVYNLRVVSADANNNTSTSANFVVTTIIPTPPVFNVWYGKTQTFGQNGNPQPYINILGNVQDGNGLRSLIYSLNGGPSVPLSIGSDKRRLTEKGDFNVDILYSTLQPTNTVIITAVDSQFTAARETVTVNYVADNSWPRTYSINWGSAGAIQNVAQIVDGRWTISNGSLRTAQLGYDRLVAIGERTWSEYEVTTSVTIHGIDSSGFGRPSDGPGVGFLMRWPGHSDLPVSVAGMQPKTGFLPLGALAWYKWGNDYSQRLEMLGNNIAVIGQANKLLSLGVRYMFKAQVSTNPGVGGIYKMKVWQDGTPEPAAWDMQGQQGIRDPQMGSLLLVAHHLDVSFGNVTIVPLEPASTIVSDDFFSNTLNTHLWTFVDPLGNSSVGILGGGTSNARAGITVPAGTKHEPWTTANTAARLMQTANDANFEVEAKFESQFTGQIQMHGILVQQNPLDYIRFDFSSSVPLEPVSTIVSDHFFSDTLNTQLWTFVDPLGNSSVEILGGGTSNARAAITVPAGTRHEPWVSSNTTARIMQSANDANFEVEAKFESQFTGQIQMHGILVQQNPLNYIRFDFSSSGANTKIFAATFANGTASVRYNVDVAGTPPYMRVMRVGTQWTLKYSYDGVTWTSTPSFSHGMIVSSIGPFAGNAGTNPAYTALVDYFINTDPPLPANTKIFAATIANGTASVRYNVDVAGTPPYMRVKRVGTQWTLKYSYDGVTWTSTPSFNHGMIVSSIGPFAGNAGTNPAYAALVDYFFNTDHPIDPEDGGGAGIPPRIVTHPVNATVVAGNTAAFAITALGTPPLQYQWQRGGVDIPNTNSPTLLVPTTSVLADSGSTFRCIVTNSVGASISNNATLSVLHAPSTIVSDDFSTGVLNTTIWRVVNPRNDATFGFTGIGTQDALLSIHVPGNIAHDIWTEGNFSPQILQAANNTNFGIETKFQSGISAVHEFHGMIAQKDSRNLVRFGFTTHSTSNFTRLFAATFVNGVPTIRINLNIVPKGVSPLYLRVMRQGNTWTMSWSQNGATFTNGGSFTHALVVDSVGVYAGNAGTTPPEYTSLIDYFFNTASPIVPEDGVPPAITSHPANRTITEGLRATFSVSTTGTSLAYQWQKNGLNIPGATSASYTTQPTTMADSGSVYRCIVSNQFGSVTSNGARLHVNVAVALPWWNNAWGFRLPIEVNTNGFERFGQPVEIGVNFTTELATLGHPSASFNTNSLRVVERDSNYNVLDSLVNFQFDRHNGFNPGTNASGTLILLVNGAGTRFFDVYFDTLGSSFSPVSIPTQVAVSDTADYQGQESFKIVTSAGTYYYHKRGAGFASMIDNSGNDWISYRPGGGSAGAFRGIPNVGDVFHPGYTNSNSFIESPGPIKTRIRSVSTSGAWEAVWDIFPRFARMTLLRNGASYWFLYEGTPGGGFELDRDFVYRSTGTRTPVSTSWSQNLPTGRQWAYFGDTQMRRVLYAIQHEDDAQPDYFRHMDGNMTIFGFGRKDPCCIRYLDAAPQTFTVGFAEDSTFSQASKVVNSAYKPITVTQRDPQVRGSSGIPLLSTIVSDNFNAPSLNASLWTYFNPLGDASLSMTGNALSIVVPGGVSHDIWTAGARAPRVMQPANNANFEVEAKFLSAVSSNIQIQGILVQQDAQNFLRFDFVRSAAGTRAFSASFINGVPTTRIDTVIAGGSPIWLRVKRTGNVWRHQFSYNGTGWITAGSYTHNLAVSSIGPFFGNAGSPVPQFPGLIDYFYNAEVPIVPTTPLVGNPEPEEQPLASEPVPVEYFLKPNYPNPFNPSTTIQYGLPEPAQVQLKVYNMLGQLVTTLAEQHQHAGYHQVRWNGLNQDGQPVSSGVYVYRLIAINDAGNAFSTLNKMMLVR